MLPFRPKAKKMMLGIDNAILILPIEFEKFALLKTKTPEFMYAAQNLRLQLQTAVFKSDYNIEKVIESCDVLEKTETLTLLPIVAPLSFYSHIRTLEDERNILAHALLVYRAGIYFDDKNVHHDEFYLTAHTHLEQLHNTILAEKNRLISACLNDYKTKKQIPEGFLSLLISFAADVEKPYADPRYRKNFEMHFLLYVKQWQTLEKERLAQQDEEWSHRYGEAKTEKETAVQERVDLETVNCRLREEELTLQKQVQILKQQNHQLEQSVEATLLERNIPLEEMREQYQQLLRKISELNREKNTVAMKAHHQVEEIQEQLQASARKLEVLTDANHELTEKLKEREDEVASLKKRQQDLWGGFEIHPELLYQTPPLPKVALQDVESVHQQNLHLRRQLAYYKGRLAHVKEEFEKQLKTQQLPSETKFFN